MVSIVLNGLIAIVSILAWLQILRGKGSDAELARRGAGSLKYYTVLSNLLSAGVSAVYLAFFLLPGKPATSVMLAFRLAAAAVVMITFLVTALLLTPQFGWRSLYKGGNFWLHLVLPLAALVDAVVYAQVGTLPLSATWGSLAFTVIYVLGYLRPILKYGHEKDGKVYDFYGFMRWGTDKFWIVAIFLLLGSWGVALACWLASKAVMAS